jgi:hypothetical protein
MIFTGSGIMASVVLVVWLNDKKETKQQHNAKNSFFMFGSIKDFVGGVSACKLYFLNNIKK